MPNPATDFNEGLPRKDLHVFYVLDTSGSMKGDKISALNHAMEETIGAMKELAKKNADANLKIAILEFNSGCKWVTPNGPEELENGDFMYEYLTAGGLTDIGAALKELNSKLSRHAWLDSMVGALMPVMIFMTDGFATDTDVFPKALEEIRKNRWFQRGTKIGFALGDDPDEAMIASVVGDKEAVIKTTDLALFERLMKFVSVTPSALVSQSQTPDTVVSGADIVRQAIKEEGLTDDDISSIPDDSYDKEPDPLPVDTSGPGTFDPNGIWDE